MPRYLKSRARKVVKRSTITPYQSIERMKVIADLGLKCHWCGVFTDNSIYNANSPNKTTIDHIYNRLDPRRMGNDDKVVVACETCNSARARMHEFIFRQQKHPVSCCMIIREIVVPTRWQKFTSWLVKFSKKFEKKVDCFLWKIFK